MRPVSPRDRPRPLSSAAPANPAPPPLQAPPHPDVCPRPAAVRRWSSASVFAHVVRLGFCPLRREWGPVGTCPSGPRVGGRGLPDSRGEAGRARREEEGGLGKSEVSLGVRTRQRLAAGGPGTWRVQGGQGSGGLGPGRPGEVRGRARAPPPPFPPCMGVPRLLAAAGALWRACRPWTPLLGRRLLG